MNLARITLAALLLVCTLAATGCRTQETRIKQTRVVGEKIVVE